MVECYLRPRRIVIVMFWVQQVYSKHWGRTHACRVSVLYASSGAAACVSACVTANETSDCRFSAAVVSSLSLQTAATSDERLCQQARGLG